MFPVFVSVSAMAELFVITIQLCEEIGLSRSTVSKLRRDGVLIPSAHYYRGHARRALMYWSTNAVAQTVRCHTACLES